jgi:maltodextrin utilization protein YvdJ
MKRFFIFVLLGPLLGALGVALVSGSIDDAARAAVRGYFVVTYSSIYCATGLAVAAWACDLVMIRMQASILVRMATVSAGVAVVATLLAGPVLASAVAGAVAGFSVWLSNRRSKTSRT